VNKKKVRMYQKFWELLKAKKHIAFECDTLDAARLKKAVIKEKDMDLAFKLESAEAGDFWILKTTSAVLAGAEEEAEVGEASRTRIEFFLELRSDCVI